MSFDSIKLKSLDELGYKGLEEQFKRLKDLEKFFDGLYILEKKDRLKNSFYTVKKEIHSEMIHVMSEQGQKSKEIKEKLVKKEEKLKKISGEDQESKQQKDALFNEIVKDQKELGEIDEKIATINKRIEDIGELEKLYSDISEYEEMTEGFEQLKRLRDAFERQLIAEKQEIPEFKEIKAHFKNLRSVSEFPKSGKKKGPLHHRYRKMVDRIVRRQQILKNHFSDAKALKKYIEDAKNKHGEKKEQYILNRVKKRVNSLDSGFKTKGNPKLPSIDDYLVAYVDKIKSYEIEVSDDFPEVASPPTLCEFSKIIEWMESVREEVPEIDGQAQTVMDQYAEKLLSLTNRWTRLTGEELNVDSVDQLPVLSEIEKRKVPIPYKPAWSVDLYSREGKKMGHKTISEEQANMSIDDNNDNQGNHDGIEANFNWIGWDGIILVVLGFASLIVLSIMIYLDPSFGILVIIPVTLLTVGFLMSYSSFSARRRTPLDKTPNRENEIDVLYKQAGAKKLKQPEEGDPLYTFPGKLVRGEDIFYDYSVIIPVNEACFPNSDEMDEYADLTSVKTLAAKAQQILDFLYYKGLGYIFGLAPPHLNVFVDICNSNYRFISTIEEVRSIDDAFIYSHKIRRWKRIYRQFASFIRMISRTQMYLTELPEGDNPNEHLDGLNAAIEAIRDTEYKLSPEKTFLPTVAERSNLPHQWTRTLWFSKSNHKYECWDDGTKRSNIYNWDQSLDPPRGYYPAKNTTHVPDAFKFSSSRTSKLQGWKWRELEEQRYDLRNYIAYLGEVFYYLLDDLVTKSEAMAAAVGSYDPFRTDSEVTSLERFAADLIQDALGTLSYFFDEIADQLVEIRKYRIEGSKRLGLQVIFRQYWHPERYVQGKLVGYKNLIPNQKESFKRRTYIKTVKEMTSTEEFAASRQDDYSRSQKETSDIVNETAKNFKFSSNASGDYDVLVWSGEATVDIETTTSEKIKSSQNMISESTYKSSAKYSEKREIKIHQLTEVEDVQEVTSEIQNMNQEITANYFYYQLLRQYLVTIDLHDVRPVLLRARNLPTPAEIDDHFISKYMHILANRLPKQLSIDAQDYVDQMDLLTKSYIRKRAESDRRKAEYETYRDTECPEYITDPQAYNRWIEVLRSKEQLYSEAYEASIDAQEEYSKARMKINRVINHIRENIAYYMQFIWHESPQIDHNMILEQEKFCEEYLPLVTQGLIRQGYYGNEEIFNYTGRSMVLLDLMMDYLISGSEILTDLGERFEESTFYQYLGRYYPEIWNEDESGNLGALKDKISELIFVKNSVKRHEGDSGDSVLDTRRVQVAQDALVVEAMPGEVPLLEGFQMAHRVLDVQKTCLENLHLASRISDKPWKNEGTDIYKIIRSEGTGTGSKEEE
ncbi:MAG: hypothetical protein ACFFD4_35850 [Candidatus Odinarchaeota archaeon]